MTSSSFHHQQDAAAIDNPTMAEESLVAVGPAAALVPTAAMIINPNFPVKLHCCLTELESYGLAHIASFQPHGRCFVVHKKDEFVKDILPRWFHQTKYTSFQRQLNVYGFERITSGVDKRGYYHPKFLRGKLHLAYDIPRVPIKGTGSDLATMIEAVPNFYKMPRLLDTPPSSSSAELTVDDDTRHDKKTSTNSQTLPRAEVLVNHIDYRNPQAESLALLPPPVLPFSTIHAPSFSGPVLPGAVSATLSLALAQARANQLLLAAATDANTAYTSSTPSLLVRLELERRIHEQIGQQQQQQHHYLSASLNLPTISSPDPSLSALRQELAVQRLLGNLNQQGMCTPATSAVAPYDASPIASLQLSELMGAAAAAAAPSLATNLAHSPETQLRAALLTDALRRM